MNCLKCGKEVSLHQVFCEDCQQSMENHPVAPGTPVVIIPRKEPRSDRDPRRKRQGYADTVRSLRKVIRNLCIALGVAALIIAVLGASLFYTLNKLEQTNTIGKNYTTMESNIQP